MLTKSKVIESIQNMAIPRGARQIAQDIINELEDDSEVVEVDGCAGCPFWHTLVNSSGIFNVCVYNKESCKQPITKLSELFATCPLKTKAITIKLKQP